VRLYYKPFVSWIWGGCLLMGIGGLLAAFDRRYRVRARAGAAQAAAAAGLNAAAAR
jgi:cytochrome c-type biogenesis protein CcmF